MPCGTRQVKGVVDAIVESKCFPPLILANVEKDPRTGDKENVYRPSTSKVTNVSILTDESLRQSLGGVLRPEKRRDGDAATWPRSPWREGIRQFASWPASDRRSFDSHGDASELCTGCEARGARTSPP